MSTPFPDPPALSTALMQLRARARAQPGEVQRGESAGFRLSWLCRALPGKMEPGTEAVGVDTGGESPEPYVRPLVDLLAAELVPVEVTHAGSRVALRFRVTPGHFRCRDCGWGDATEAKATYQGLCAACAEDRRHRYTMPAPKTLPEAEQT